MPSYAALWHAGDSFNAYDRSPRFGGKPVARCCLEEIRRQPLVLMPDADFEAEGFAYLAESGATPSPNCPLDSFTMAAFRQWRWSGGFLRAVI